MNKREPRLLGEIIDELIEQGELLPNLKQKVMDYRHCLIYGWMAKTYLLSGVSLIIYAILFSTSQGDFTCHVDWDFIKLCTGLTPNEVEPILQSFKERGMIEYDGIYYKTIDID